MNIWKLADDFRQAFEDAPAFALDHQLHGQGDEDFETPCQVFSVTEEVFSQNGKAAKFTLMVQVYSSSVAVVEDADPDAEHAARVTAVREMLLGEGKAPLKSWLNGLGRWDVKGWCAAGEDPEISGSRFFTPVRITGTVLEL